MRFSALMRCAGIVGLVAAVQVPGLSAEVLEAADGGFTSRNELTVSKDPESAYRDLIDVASWWDSTHTFSGSASNLSLDAVPNGCFCERLPNGGGVRHAVVLFAEPGRRLRLEGSLGPLQEHAVTGVLTFAIEKTAGGTHVVLTYRVGGHLDGGLQKIAPIVDQVLAGQMRRLQNFIERGRP